MTGVLSAAEHALLVEHGQELLELEERYGTQRAALEARPDLALAAEALQLARAQVAAEAMGLELRGDGRALRPTSSPNCTSCSRASSRKTISSSLAGIATPSGLTRFLDDHPVDDGAK